MHGGGGHGQQPRHSGGAEPVGPVSPHDESGAAAASEGPGAGLAASEGPPRAGLCAPPYCGTTHGTGYSLDCCQRGNRFSAPNDGHRTAPGKRCNSCGTQSAGTRHWFPDVVADGNRAEEPQGWDASGPWDDLWEYQGSPLTVERLTRAMADAIASYSRAWKLPFVVELYDGAGVRQQLVVTGISFTGNGAAPDAVTMTVIPRPAP